MNRYSLSIENEVFARGEEQTPDNWCVMAFLGAHTVKKVKEFFGDHDSAKKYFQEISFTTKHPNGYELFWAKDEMVNHIDSLQEIYV